MKKIFYFILALALSTGNAMAFEFENEPEAGLSFMGLFGMNISKLQNSNYGAKAGAQMGIRADYMLPKAHGTYLTAGIDWTMKGGKFSDLFLPSVTPLHPTQVLSSMLSITLKFPFASVSATTFKTI